MLLLPDRIPQYFLSQLNSAYSLLAINSNVTGGPSSEPSWECVSMNDVVNGLT